VEDLAPKKNEMRIFKHRYSGFFQTDLDLVLKDLACDQLVIFGVVTNICVRSTVHDAFFNGYTVVVPEDCCAATGPREQASSLYDIATHFGVVSDSFSVVAALATGSALVNKALA
jgi:ureidoacrylate peracid hydrolase